MRRNDKTNKVVLTGLMMCMVTVATMFFKVPIPFTQGYVHLGDSMIFLSLLVLGRRNGTIAAGVGSALGDVLGGYAFWAPWTLIIKALMAYIMGSFIERMEKKKNVHSGSGGESKWELLGMALAGMVMTVGYYLVEVVMYGNWATPLPSVPFNIGQFAVGMIIATTISTALCKTAAKKYFATK